MAVGFPSRVAGLPGTGLLASSGAILFTLVASFSVAAQDGTPLAAEHAAIDVHTHVASQILTDFFTGGGIPNKDADDLLAKLDEANVDRAVILSAGYFGKLVGFNDDSRVGPENDFVATEVARHPDRLIGFCGINPLFPSALAEVDRCLDLPGMIGIKLHMEASNVDLSISEDAAALSAVLDRAVARDAPVLIHVSGPTGMPLAGAELSTFGSIVATHPEIRMTLAHCGSSDEGDALEAWLRAGARGFDLSRMFVDTSACLAFYADAPLAMREMMVWRLRKWGIERVLFGSDYFAFLGDTPKLSLDILTRYPFTQAEIDTILANDGHAWLGAADPRGQ